MQRLITLTIILTLVSIDGFSQSDSTTKNYWIIGMNAGLSELVDESIFSLGFNAGYEINFRKLPFLTIDPIIGVGIVRSSVLSTFKEFVLSSYKIQYFTFGVAPKLQIINPDRDALLYFENELSFWNGAAEIEDEGYDQSRKNRQYFNFYYSPKVGIAIKVNDEYLSIWVGVSTLNMNKILNHNLHYRQEEYSDQNISLCCGFKILF